VALATIGPDSYAGMIAGGAVPGRGVLNVERELFGLDHCQAGRLLVAAWGLPEDFCAITAHHHDPLTHTEDATELIRLSCRLADALGFAVAAQDAPRSCEEVLAEFPVEVQTHLPAMEELNAQIAKEISVIEGAEKNMD